MTRIKKMSNNRGHKVTKEIVKIIMINEDKKVKSKYELKNKLNYYVGIPNTYVGKLLYHIYILLFKG